MKNLPTFVSSCLLGFTALLMMVAFTGCDQVSQVIEAEESTSHWLNGTWEFDEAFTESHWKDVRDKHDTAEGGVSGMIDAAKHWGEEAAAPWILSGERGKKLKFNGVERITMTGDKGKGEAYLVIDAPHDHEATLQFTDGSIVVYKLVGDYLRVPFDSKFANYVFYRRVD